MFPDCRGLPCVCVEMGRSYGDRTGGGNQVQPSCRTEEDVKHRSMGKLVSWPICITVFKLIAPKLQSCSTAVHRVTT